MASNDVAIDINEGTSLLPGGRSAQSKTFFQRYPRAPLLITSFCIMCGVSTWAAMTKPLTAAEKAAAESTLRAHPATEAVPSPASTPVAELFTREFDLPPAPVPTHLPTVEPQPQEQEEKEGEPVHYYYPVRERPATEGKGPSPGEEATRDYHYRELVKPAGRGGKKHE